jgi:hypothetical protein
MFSGVALARRVFLIEASDKLPDHRKAIEIAGGTGHGFIPIASDLDVS